MEAYIRQRREQAIGTLTVERAARKHFAEASKELSQRTQDLWLSRLEQHAFPIIGHMKMDEVAPRDIKRVLLPIWEKAETARRVRSRLSQLFKWAIVEGHYAAGNPVSGVEEGLPKNTRETKHHEALPWKDLPAFTADLAGRGGSTARCLELLILTGGILSKAAALMKMSSPT